MCGRFAMDSRVNEEITDFVTRTGRKPEDWRADWEANYNIAPTQRIPVLIDSAKTGELRFEQGHLGREDGRLDRVDPPIDPDALDFVTGPLAMAADLPVCFGARPVIGEERAGIAERPERLGRKE